MPCLSHEMVLAFVEGSLPDGEAGTVDTHMDGCSSCRALVAELARAAPCEPPQGKAPAPLSASTLGPGDVLAARFCILRKLGRGAMGVVCEADDRELGVRVALKLLRHEAAASPRLLERLRKEAVLGRRVTHPNVCRLHDFGISEGVAFLSMELLEGVTLATLMSRPLDPRRALRLLEQIADALEAAHAHGVIHRDLKPSNIMVGANDKVSVMDFGLAHDLDADASEHGLAVGTPAYWSPEQARGEAATERSDIYSLGLIACELFGARPRSTTAERLSVLPRRYRSVVARCLAEQPERRYESVPAMRQALRAADRKLRAPFMRRRFAYGVAVAAVTSALLVSVRPSAADQASASLGDMAERTARVSPPVTPIAAPKVVSVVPPKRSASVPRAVTQVPPAVSSAPAPKPLPFFE